MNGYIITPMHRRETVKNKISTKRRVVFCHKLEFFHIFSAFLKKRRRKLQAKLSQSSIQYKCTQQSDGSILFHLSKQQQAEDLSKEGQCR